MPIKELRAKGFEVEFRSHAEAILTIDFPTALAELEDALLSFTIPMAILYLTNHSIHIAKPLGLSDYLVVSPICGGCAPSGIFGNPSLRPSAARACPASSISAANSFKSRTVTSSTLITSVRSQRTV